MFRRFANVTSPLPPPPIRRTMERDLQYCILQTEYSF